jgi:hypothetical protein
MVDACDLVSIHNHKHVHTPPTQTSGSTQIDFIFMSSAAAEFIFRCDILDFKTLFSSNHCPLYKKNDILRLLHYPVYGTIRALERDLKLNNPRLIDAYQATLIQQLINHNAGPRVDALYIVDPSSWASHHESRFNAIYHDVQRAMYCAAKNCRCKYFKNNTWTVTFTRIIYQIRFWRLQQRLIENGPRCGQQQTLFFYAVKSSLHTHTIQDTLSVQVCLQGIVTAKREMKIEILYQSKAKLLYQHDLATDIIDIKHAHLCVSPTLSDKILHDDLIKNKIRSMNESIARRNLFTLLKFKIKGFINLEHQEKCSQKN